MSAFAASVLDEVDADDGGDDCIAAPQRLPESGASEGDAAASSSTSEGFVSVVVEGASVEAGEAEPAAGSSWSPS